MRSSGRWEVGGGSGSSWCEVYREMMLVHWTHSLPDCLSSYQQWSIDGNAHISFRFHITKFLVMKTTQELVVVFILLSPKKVY